MKTIIVLVISFVACSAFAQVSGWLGASVDETGLVEIQAYISNWSSDSAPDDWNEIVIVRSIHGLCDEPEIITPTPWTMPEPGSSVDIRWSEPIPRPHLHYHYEVKVRDDSGDFQFVWGQFPYDHVSYGEAVATRGRLTLHLGFDDCEEGCWDICSDWLNGEGIPGISEQQMWIWAASGQVLNVYGEYHFTDMVPNCYIDVVRVEEHDGDCGPIPNRTMSWGDIKASYR